MLYRNSMNSFHQPDIECRLCLCAVHQQLHHTEVWSEGALRSGWLLRRGGPALPAGGDRHSAAYTTDVPTGTGYSTLLYSLNEPKLDFCQFCNCIREEKSVKPHHNIDFQPISNFFQPIGDLWLTHFTDTTITCVSLLRLGSIKAGLEVRRKSFCEICTDYDFNAEKDSSYLDLLPNFFQRYTTGVLPCSTTSCPRRSCRGWSCLFWPPLWSPHSSSAERTVRWPWRWPEWQKMDL